MGIEAWSDGGCRRDRCVADRAPCWRRRRRAGGAMTPTHYNDFEITPFVGYMAGGEFEDPLDGSDRDLDADTNFGIIFNFAAASTWRHYELLYASQSTQVEGVDAVRPGRQYLQIGGIVSYPDVERVIPYFGMTVGATQFSPDARRISMTRPSSRSASAGGLRYRSPITSACASTRARSLRCSTPTAISSASPRAPHGGPAASRAQSATRSCSTSASLGVIVGF